ncbi:MAG: hypothetical protein GDA54_03420 [Alphaproteobacteria bacterium GM7ARS4]|nr:hypothetical protein [Alphaproteobacteria bacterium GM7ARS4]
MRRFSSYLLFSVACLAIAHAESAPAHAVLDQALEAMTDKIGDAFDNAQSPLLVMYRMHRRFQDAQTRLSTQSQAQLHDTLRTIRGSMHTYNATIAPHMIETMRSLLTAKTIDQQALRHTYRQWRDSLTDRIDHAYDALETLVLTLPDDERHAFLTELLKDPLPFMPAPSLPQ